MSTKRIIAAGALVALAAAGVAVGTAVAAGRQPADTAVPTRPAVLGSFPDVVNALSQGEDVEVTTTLGQCYAPDGHTPGPEVTGGLHIQGFQIPQNDFIAFSDTHETLDPKNAKITEFIRYRVTPDGSVTVATTTLDASGHAQPSPVLTCKIGHGAEFHGH